MWLNTSLHLLERYFRTHVVTWINWHVAYCNFGNWWLTWNCYTVYTHRLGRLKLLFRSNCIWTKSGKITFVSHQRFHINNDHSIRQPIVIDKSNESILLYMYIFVFLIYMSYEIMSNFQSNIIVINREVKRIQKQIWDVLLDNTYYNVNRAKYL